MHALDAPGNPVRRAILRELRAAVMEVLGLAVVEHNAKSNRMKGK